MEEEVKNPSDQNVIIVGPAFDFWFDGEDDIYDEHYKSLQSGGSVVR
jgi:hypothetical protein